MSKDSSDVQIDFAVEKLSDMGWDLPSDPYLAQLSRTMMKDVISDLTAYLATVPKLPRDCDDWSSRRATWEESLSPGVSRDQRERFLKACTLAGSTPEFIVDAKRRWEKGWFTSVSEKYLVVGDVWVDRVLGDSLIPYCEVDLPGENAGLGRLSLTYERWATVVERGEKIQGVRLKVNGERFLVEPCGSGSVLRGFVTFYSKTPLPYTVLEYYAGTFFVISGSQESGTISLEHSGFIYHIEVKSHTFVLPSQISAVDLHSSKYDGLMVLLDGVEYRAKWQQSDELLLDGVPWEVRFDVLNSHQLPVRPRPGKRPILERTAKINAGNSVGGHLLLQSLLSFQKKIVPLETSPTVHMSGSKCVFLAPGGIVMIKEPSKRWDLIGGTLERGETPIVALIREVKEETGIEMSSEDFLPLGSTEAKTEETVWVSHVFVAVAPPSLLSLLGSSYHDAQFALLRSSLKKINRTEELRPRAIWVARHIDHILPFGSVDVLWDMCRVVGLAPVEKRRLSIPVVCLSFLRPYYVSFIRRYVDFNLKPRPAREALSQIWYPQKEEPFDIAFSEVLGLPDFVVTEPSPSEPAPEVTEFSSLSQEEVQRILRDIFKDSRSMTAQAFYQVASSVTGRRTRRPLALFVTRCEKLGYLSSYTVSTGKIFKLELT